MKKLQLMAILVIAIIVFALPVAAHAASNGSTASATNVAPALDVRCETNAQGQEVCYKEVPAINAVYGTCEDLGEGWEARPGSDTECQKEVDDSKWGSDFNRPQKCEDGYDMIGSECKQLVTPGYWDEKSAPVASPESWSCPTVQFTASRMICPEGYSEHGNKCRKWNWDKWEWQYAEKVPETFGPINVTYNKSSDPNKCHKPSPSQLGIPSWASSDYGKLDEWMAGIYTPPTYGNCSDLGDGWVNDSVESHTCKKWVDPVYNIKTPIFDDCPAPSVPTSSGTMCHTWFTGSHMDYEGLPLVSAATCPQGSNLMDGKCMEQVTCPLPTEPPATEPPATEPPATEPPATEPPATKDPNVPVNPTVTPMPPARARNSCEMVADWENEWNTRPEGWPDPKLVPNSSSSAFPQQYLDYKKECDAAKASHGVPAGSPSGWQAFVEWIKSWWK